MFTQDNQSTFEIESGFYGPGKKPIFFLNEGIFDDPTMASLPHTSNINLRRFWDTEDLPDFSKAYEWMLDRWEKESELFKGLDEAQLEERWIRPIMKLLGWEYQVQDRFKHLSKQEIPDYSLFESEAKYRTANGCRSNEAYFDHVLAVADAKKMGVPLDGSKLNKTNPSYQIWWYLTITGKDWGILTDGLKWRIYSPKARMGHYNFYEVKIDRMLSERDDQSFKFFYNFFRKEAFKKDGVGSCFLDLLHTKAAAYSKDIESALQSRAFHIVDGLAKGFATNFSASELERAEVREQIYSHSLYYLFRLMFVLNAEARGLLAVGKQESYYKYSLRSQSLELIEDFKRNSTWSSVPRSYDYLQSLMRLLEKGDESIGIHGFGTEIFDTGEKSFYTKNKIPDSVLNPILLDLTFSKLQEKFVLIDFKCLSVDHIGSIFEGLLEFSLEVATKNIEIETNFFGVSSDGRTKGSTAVKKGEIFLSSNGKSRKEFGAFYTKDYIVNYMVQKTFAPIVKDLSAAEVLNLTVTDPAMGSGHFLIGAVSYLDRVIQEKLLNEDDGDLDTSEIKWKVMQNCVFGVDKNPLSTELAKFSLWIMSARSGYALTSLKNNLKSGNSIIGDDFEEVTGSALPANIKPFNWKTEFKSVFSNGGFDAVIGNPPFIETKLIAEAEKPYLYSKYESMFEKSNYYVCFFELSSKLLKSKPHVKLAFVTPPDWLDAQKSYKPLKHYLIENFRLEEICKLDKNAFPVPTNVYFFNRTKAGRNNIVASALSSTDQVGDWKVTTEKDPRTVEEVFSLNTTITGDLPVLLDGAEIVKLATDFRIEMGISLTGDKFEESFDGKGRFLSEGVKDQMLLARSDVVTGFNYATALKLKSKNDRLRTADLFVGEKLIIKRRPFTVVFDDETLYCKSNCMILRNNDGQRLDLKSLAIIMNSSWFKNFISEKSQHAQVGIDLFEELEVPFVEIPNSKELMRELARLPYPKQVELIDHVLNGGSITKRKAS